MAIIRLPIILIFLLFFSNVYSQPNCEAFKFYGDTLKYKACLMVENRSGHYQFSSAYQEGLDEALAIDSSYAYAYRAKSTAYVKSGDFITWKQLMDKAVEYDPKGQIGYRGWCRYQFFRDYKGAISDIELLDSLVDYDIGYSVNGNYHLHMARALCYKAIGKPQDAIRIIEKNLSENSNSLGLYDYLHLGVLKLEVGNYKEAITILQKQEIENDLAENRFYIALAYNQLGMVKEYLKNLEIAKYKYENEQRLLDPYSSQMDKIYLKDIIKELEMAHNN